MLSLLSFELPVRGCCNTDGFGEDDADAVELIGFAATKPIAAARSLLVLLPLLRFRLLITSVLSEIGRGRPFILKKRAHALQRMCVLSWDRRQRGVVCRARRKRSKSVYRFYHERDRLYRGEQDERSRFFPRRQE